VSTQEGKEFARSMSMLYIEASAKSEEGTIGVTMVLQLGHGDLTVVSMLYMEDSAKSDESTILPRF
jgi:hypothetical protein